MARKVRQIRRKGKNVGMVPASTTAAPDLDTRVALSRDAQVSAGADGSSALLGCTARVNNAPMTNRAQQLLREALTLPVDERADVAAELLASLDESSTMDAAAVETAWAREIERRARRVMAGQSPGEPWEDVRARVGRRLAGR